MRLVRRFCCVGIVILAAASPIRAAIVANWNVAGGGSWNAGANWSPAGTVPGATEDASFGTGAVLPSGTSTITLDGSQTVYGVTSSPGSGKTVAITAGTGGTLTVVSTDSSTDGSSTFFALSATNGTTTIAPTVQLGSASTTSSTATFNSFVNATNFNITGAINEAAGQTWGVRIVGNGTGIVNYSTTAKTYSGDTTIATNGILKINNNDMIPNGTGKGNVVIEGSGQLQVNNVNDTINGLSSTSSTSAVTRTGTNSRSLTVGDGNATASFAGNITSTAASSNGNGFAIGKIGSGTQTLSGSANGWNGATTVTGGTLLINGTHTPVTNSGATLNTANGYTVASGATLGGNGTINLGTGGGTGAALANSLGVTIQNGGTLAPGASVGTLTINIPVVLNPTSNLAYELIGTDMTVGGGINDLLTGVTNLTLGGTLNVTETSAGSFLSASAGNSWRLINYSGSLVNNVLALGAMPSLQSGLAFQIDTATANQVNLLIASTAVPEASAFLFGGVVCCVSGLGYFYRRRYAKTL